MADTEKSHTQTYNCDKLNEFNVGYYLDLERFAIVPEGVRAMQHPLLYYLKEPTPEIKSNITFHQLLLTDDQRIARSDL